MLVGAVTGMTVISNVADPQAKSRVLFCFRSAVLRSDSVFLTHVCATLFGPVALAPSEVVDFRRQIYPNNRYLWGIEPLQTRRACVGGVAGDACLGAGAGAVGLLSGAEKYRRFDRGERMPPVPERGWKRLFDEPIPLASSGFWTARYCPALV